MTETKLPRKTAIQRWAGRGTLGRRLFLLFIAFSLGPLFVSNVWGYLVSRMFWIDSMVKDARRIATVEADRTLESVRLQLDQIDAMSTGDNYLRSVVASLALELTDAERSALHDKLRRHLAARADETARLHEFLVLSTTGTLLGSSRIDRPVGTDLSASACFLPDVDSVKLQGLKYGGPEPTVVLVAPLQTPGGTTFGTLCAMHNFDTHHALVAARHELDDRGDIYLLDQNRRVICGSGHDHKGQDHHEFELGQRVAQRAHDQIDATEAWQATYEIEGHEIIGAFVPVEELGWGVLVEVPLDAVLADLERLKWQAIGLGVVLAVILTLAIFIVSRGLATQLARVAAAAKRIAGGARGESIPTSGPTELAELAEAFNYMSRAVEDSHRFLEDRIVERTKELRESQEFTELLIDSIDQRVVVVDKNHLIIKANRAALQTHGSDLVGRNYDEVFADRLRADGADPVRRTFETGRTGLAEHWEGSGAVQEIVVYQTYPIFSSDGSVDSVVEIGRVATDEKQIQAQMIHHEKMAAFGLLAAGVAHEIGNPLAAIQSQLRMTRDDPEPTRVAATLEIVDKEVARIGRLLRELVDFARRKRDSDALVSVNQVVEDVARLLNHDPRAGNVEIEKKLLDNLPGVRTREDHLVQVLLNLGINALDAMPSGGRLSFETTAYDGKVAVMVSDTGGGIPPALRDRVFEPFFTTKAPEQGTGLGLFVSRAIIAELGGELVLERTGDDGTVFRMELDTEGGLTGEAKA